MVKIHPIHVLEKVLLDSQRIEENVCEWLDVNMQQRVLCASYCASSTSPPNYYTYTTSFLVRQV